MTVTADRAEVTCNRVEDVSDQRLQQRSTRESDKYLKVFLWTWSAARRSGQSQLSLLSVVVEELKEKRSWLRRRGGSQLDGQSSEWKWR